MNIVKAVKAFFAVKKVVKSIEEAKMKSGIYSTEFFLNLVSIVGTAYGALSGFIPQELSMKVIAFLVVAYTLARSLVKVAEIVVKLTASTKDDAIVAGVDTVLDKIEDTFGKTDVKPE